MPDLSMSDLNLSSSNLLDGTNFSRPNSQVSEWMPSGLEPSNLRTFLVCGMTGSGKSTFINIVTGAELAVSDEIDADPSDVIEEGIPLIKMGNIYMQLVDTPGFGDPERPDTEIFRLIATWLAARYRSNALLSGVIFLRPITDTRVQRQERLVMNIFKDICGDDCLEHLIVVTTRWASPPKPRDEARESAIITREVCFGSNGPRQVRVHRLNKDYSQADGQQLTKLCSYLSPIPFHIQREIVDRDCTLEKTAAGMRLDSSLETRLIRIQDQIKDGERNNIHLLRTEEKMIGDQRKDLAGPVRRVVWGLFKAWTAATIGIANSVVTWSTGPAEAAGRKLLVIIEEILPRQ